MKTPQLLYNTHNQISFKTETMIEIELNNWYASQKLFFCVFVKCSHVPV